jgi:membrane fusion protein, multidrug efflux system
MRHTLQGDVARKIGGVVVTMALTVAGCSGGRDAPSDAAAARPGVTVVEAVKETVPIVTAGGNGTTRALEEVTIRARVKGFLTEIHFKEGQDVKKDTLLLVIDKKPFENQRDQAVAKLDEAKAALEKAEKSKAREVAKAQVGVDDAMLGLAEVEARRERALFERKATPREEVNRKDALLKKSQAQVESSKASLEQAKADFDVNISGARASVESAQAALQDAQIELGYCAMRAPIDGRIGELRVKVGNVVGPDKDSDLVTIRQLDPMGVEFRPSSRYLPLLTDLVKKGLNAELFLQGGQKAADRKHPYPAVVYFLDNQVDTTTSTVLMKARVRNPDQSLLPGEYIKASAVLGELKDAVVIPERAVFEAQEGPTVYVVDKGVVQRVRITPAVEATVPGRVVVKSGLSPGQQVIVEGLQYVRPGMEVQTELAPSDAPAAGSSKSP